MAAQKPSAFCSPATGLLPSPPARWYPCPALLSFPASGAQAGRPSTTQNLFLFWIRSGTPTGPGCRKVAVTLGHAYSYERVGITLTEVGRDQPSRHPALPNDPNS